jgi:hypothetical protein
MYLAKFQDINGYYLSLDAATFEQAFKFLSHNVSAHPQYKMAVIKSEISNQEVLSFRTIK